MNVTEQFDHPAWLTVLGTVVGYGVILFVMFLALFVLPFFVYTNFF
jgi:hypothetical protein